MPAVDGLFTSVLTLLNDWFTPLGPVAVKLKPFDVPPMVSFFTVMEPSAGWLRKLHDTVSSWFNENDTPLCVASWLTSSTSARRLPPIRQAALRFCVPPPDSPSCGTIV